VNEETKDSRRIPRNAGVISALIILIIYAPTFSAISFSVVSIVMYVALNFVSGGDIISDSVTACTFFVAEYLGNHYRAGRTGPDAGRAQAAARLVPRRDAVRGRRPRWRSPVTAR